MKDAKPALLRQNGYKLKPIIFFFTAFGLIIEMR